MTESEISDTLIDAARSDVANIRRFKGAGKLLRTEGLKVHKRLIRPSPSPLRNLVKSALRAVNISDELCVSAVKA